MATEAPVYDLMLLLSTSAEDEQRAKILSDVESAIASAGGSIERNDQWGQRPMAYEIRHQPQADYHLLQFKAPPTLIEELSHTLHITDGVLRFRVIKVRPGTPAAPSSPPPVVAAVASSGHSGGTASAGGGGGAAERASEPAEAGRSAVAETAEDPRSAAAETAEDSRSAAAETAEAGRSAVAETAEDSDGEASAES